MFFKIIVGIIVLAPFVMGWLYAICLIIYVLTPQKYRTREDAIGNSQEEDLKINITLRMGEPKKEMTLQEKRYAE